MIHEWFFIISGQLKVEVDLGHVTEEGGWGPVPEVVEGVEVQSDVVDLIGIEDVTGIAIGEDLSDIVQGIEEVGVEDLDHERGKGNEKERETDQENKKGEKGDQREDVPDLAGIKIAIITCIVYTYIYLASFVKMV